MSTRDELIESLDQDKFWDISDGYAAFMVNKAADALIAEGWRKMPSRDEVLSALSNARRSWRNTITADAEVQWLSDAILALMDGGQ